MVRASVILFSLLCILAGCPASPDGSPPPSDGDDDSASPTPDPTPEPPCADGATRPCENDCGTGIEHCIDSEWSPCSAPPPGEEVCDGLDNNCDGAVDEELHRWVAEPIDHVATAHPQALAVDPVGQAFVAYLDGAVGIEADTVKLARRVGEGWSSETVGTFHEAQPGNVTVALDLGVDGTPFIAWARLDYPAPGGGGTMPGGVHVAQPDALGGWTVEELVHDSASGDSLDLAVDPFGDLHLCHQRGTAELWYGLRREGVWTLELVVGGVMWGDALYGGDCSIAVTDDGMPFISFARHSFDTIEDFELRVAARSGSGWTIDVVDSASATGADSSIELDVSGRPRVAYRTYDPLVDLRFAQWDGVAWQVETVDGPGNLGGYASLALDAEGDAWIAHFDWTEEILRGARQVDGGWTLDVIDDGPDTGRHPSIAVGGDGVPQVTYVDGARDELDHARWICCPAGGCRAGPWSAITEVGAPSARTGHSATWTGDELIVWGGDGAAGSLNTGAAWDPSTDVWRPLATTDAPSGRSNHSAVWTGTEFIVWGGRDGPMAKGDGARYDPGLDLWSPLPLNGAPTGRWAHSAAWTGDDLIVWGGQDGAGPLASGARYDPLADDWTPMATDGAPSPRSLHGAVWTGTELFLWGGWGDDSLGDGARYDPFADLWTPLPPSGAPEARSQALTLWTGAEVFVWGGFDGWSVADDQRLGDGARYDPSTDLWSPISMAESPSARYGHRGDYSGDGAFLWGGRDDRATETGAFWEPATDRWWPLTLAGAPSARTGHTATWVGAGLAVWGGDSPGPTATGALWRPAEP